MVRRIIDAVRRHAWLLKAAAAAAALVAVVVLLRRTPVEQWLAWLTDRTQDLGPWGPVAFVLAFVAVTALLLPSTPVTLSSGAVFGPVWGAVIIAAGAMIGAALMFGIGRLVGRRTAERWVSGYPRLHALYHAMGHTDGWKIVAAVRVAHLTPYGMQCYLFGASPVRFWPYMLATAGSMLPGAIFYAYVGHAGAQAIAGEPVATESWVTRGVFLAVAAVALTYITQFARRVMRRKIAQEQADLAVTPAGSPQSP